MARKRVKNVSARKDPERVTKNGIFSRLNFTESYTSLILGGIVVLVIGILFFSFAKGNKNMQTSSVNENPKTETGGDDNSNTSSTYTIKPGDDLWSISENVYQDGYKWLEIAKTNKLENPGLIHVGNKLTIPAIVRKEPTAMKPQASPKAIDKIMENNAITSDTYSVKEGDNLWDICVRAYGDGYKWVEIAKVNNLENPDLIYSDNVLTLPR